MTTDVRTLLHDAADAPERAPDIALALHSARTRRRRQRGLGGLVAVVLIALVVGLVAVGGGGGDDRQIAVGLRQSGSGSQVPDGWKVVPSDHGITLSVPADWTAQPTGETPIGVPVLSMSDLTPDADPVLVGCTTGSTPSAPPTAAGSALTMWEFAAGSVEVPGTANNMLHVVDRPETFAGALIRGAPASETPCANARFDQLAFRDADRVFMVRVVSVFPTAEDEDARLALAAQVLDTLHVEPLEVATTTTMPDSTTQPKITTPPTTAAPFVPKSDDETEIVALIDRWLYAQSDDGVRATIVDADSILDLIHEGMSEYQMNLPDGYTGTLTSLQFTDATHADFVFTLLLHGSPLYANQTGAAVKVDGRWMITRESECSLLAHGALICPPE